VNRRSIILLSTLCLLVACKSKDSPQDAGDAGANDDMPFVPSLDAACAVGGAKAKLKHLNLVVVYDRSGSMGDGVNGDPTQKWDPVGAGLEAFFQDLASVGVTASLSFFPSVKNYVDQCNEDEYLTGDVPLTALPSTAFATAISATTPMGDTPTLPAVQGGIYAAQQLAMTDPTAKSAIVLVTDGEPDTCNSSVQNVSQAVQTVALVTPTYVIGVGSDTTDLSEISMAGGTGSPIIATVGDPTQTQSDIQSALASIRGQQVPCDFALPAPPVGQTLDVNKVNVLYTPSSGPQQALGYSVDCAGNVGWRYDNAMMPTEVILCTTTCETVQADKGADIEILFGCATQVIE
jgi:hypothetical protein